LRTATDNRCLYNLLSGFTLAFFVDRAPRYVRVKKNQLDAKFIFSICRQLLHVSGISIAHHQEVHTIDTTICISCSF